MKEVMNKEYGFEKIDKSLVFLGVLGVLVAMKS